MKRFPLQPIEEHRFVANKVVRYLLDNGGIDMNDLAVQDFPQTDREQFAQLIGYSISGAGDLDYFSDESIEAAMMVAEKGVSEEAARIEELRSTLDAVRKAMKDVVAILFSIHPDDLNLRG